MAVGNLLELIPGYPGKDGGKGRITELSGGWRFFLGWFKSLFSCLFLLEFVWFVWMGEGGNKPPRIRIGNVEFQLPAWLKIQRPLNPSSLGAVSQLLQTKKKPPKKAWIGGKHFAVPCQGHDGHPGILGCSSASAVPGSTGTWEFTYPGSNPSTSTSGRRNRSR